jgi:hypothetical protein
MAVGKPRYVEMAVDMALSLREHTHLPIAIAVDQGLAEVLLDRYRGVFDEVVQVPDRFLDGRALKYGTAAATPFDETMFVDADCVVLSSLEGLWSVLDRTDMAMVGEVGQLFESIAAGVGPELTILAIFERGLPVPLARGDPKLPLEGA